MKNLKSWVLMGVGFAVVFISEALTYVTSLAIIGFISALVIAVIAVMAREDSASNADETTKKED